MNLIVLFNHNLTEEQKQDAKESLHISDFILPPERISMLWKNISPSALDLEDYLTPVWQWLLENAKQDDYFLCEGDYGASFMMVTRAFSLGLKPIYATTARDAKEMPLADGSTVITRNFKHVMFREYRK